MKEEGQELKEGGKGRGIKRIERGRKRVERGRKRVERGRKRILKEEGKRLK
jgi:hypothetical protein